MGEVSGGEREEQNDKGKGRRGVMRRGEEGCEEKTCDGRDVQDGKRLAHLPERRRDERNLLFTLKDEGRVEEEEGKEQEQEQTREAEWGGEA